MRELCVDLFSTLDGYGAGGSAPYWGYGGPELDAWVDAQLAVEHVMLMGATTYRLLAAISADGGDPSPRMTELPKVVFSSTLRPPATWANTTVVDEPVATAVPAMKAAPGPPMRTIGSRSLARSLLALSLVDRIRLAVFPTLRGATGHEPVLEALPDVDLDLAATTVLDDRVVLLDYRVLGVTAAPPPRPVPPPGT